MPVETAKRRSKCQHLLDALQAAIAEGAVWQYESLLNQALAAGASEEEIDAVAHEAITELLAEAERPLTSYHLARTRSRS